MAGCEVAYPGAMTAPDPVEEARERAEDLVEDFAESVDDAIDRAAGVPAEGVIERFTDDGSTLVVETRAPVGSADGAPTFVLIHGIGMGRKAFADVTRLLETYATSVSIDLPGYGEAPEPARTPTVERMADTVAAYIRHRGLRNPVVVGHSMGSQIVIEIAARHPDLTDRIVLVAPTVDSSARRGLQQLLRLGRDLLRESPRVLLLGAREYLRAGPNLRRKMKAMLVHRPEDSLSRVRARTLVLRGENDYVCPDAWCRSVSEGLATSEFAVVPQHGHETMISDAEPALRVIREWLER